MAFSNAAGLVTVSGTESISAAFADSFNSPSGDAGIYIDKRTLAGGTTLQNWNACTSRDERASSSILGKYYVETRANHVSTIRTLE